MTTHQNTAHCLSNWGAYSRSLKGRGNVVLWLDPSTLSAWEGSGRETYSDLAIEVSLKVRSLFRLPLRQAEGFLEGVLSLLAPGLEVPDYSTVSRRSASLEVGLPRLPASGPVHLVVDSTGLKVFGEGEWKVRMHGAGKRRQWRKLHLAVDESSGLVLAQALTGKDCHDDTAFPELLSMAGTPVRQVSADGAYDRERSRLAIAEAGAAAAIPPRKDALLARIPEAARGSPAWEAANGRNLAVHALVRDGYSAWARESGYSRRSLAECAVSRIKRSFGGELRARLPERQRAEAAVRCALLNAWTLSCRPEYRAG